MGERAPASQRLRFSSAAGDILAARLDRPAGAPRAWALFAHCFTCGKDLRSLGRIARTLVASGIAVLRFDFTGIGESGGELARTTFASNLDDLVAASDFMRRQLTAPTLLVGHSLGGAAVLAAARRIPEARGVATIAAPADTTRFRATLLARVPELAAGGEGDITLGGSRYRISRALLDDLSRHDLGDAAARLGRALLVFHSPDDATVPIGDGELLFARARQPKSFVALPGADHLLLEREDLATYVGETIAAWVRSWSS